MRKILWAAGIAAAALLPTAALAQQGHEHDGRGAAAHADRWADAGTGTLAREAWLDHRINEGVTAGTVGRLEARQALRTLAQIRQDDANMRRHGGELSPGEQRQIQDRLDSLIAPLRFDAAERSGH